MRISTLIVAVLVSIDVVLSLWILLHNNNIAVLNPAGIIATKESNLIIVTTLLMLIVVIPVFALTIFIVLRYREGNTNAKYTPDWDHNKKLEALWWGIPMAIIFVLSLFAWQSSHDLDPYKQLPSNNTPLTINVISLDWKWLFIYPQQHIATVNLIEIPQNTPVNFYITSDSVMNSFWIPSLGGQIYAMPGMSTQLHLIANKQGSYTGSSANISGKGFADMTFITKSVSQTEFNQWVQRIQTSPLPLTVATYNQLVKPSETNAVSYYSSIDTNLYNTVIMKYIMPQTQMKMMNPNDTMN